MLRVGNQSLYGGAGRTERQKLLVKTPVSSSLVHWGAIEKILILKVKFTAARLWNTRGSVSVLSHGCFKGLEQAPHLSRDDLLWCLNGFQVGPWLHLAMAAFKALSLHVSSFSTPLPWDGKRAAGSPNLLPPHLLQAWEQQVPNLLCQGSFLGDWNRNLPCCSVTAVGPWGSSAVPHLLAPQPLSCLWKVMFVSDGFYVFFSFPPLI